MHAVSFALLVAASSPTAPSVRVTPSVTLTRAPAQRPDPGASPGSSRPATFVDRAANLEGGVWQCDTLAGSTGTHTYVRNEDDGTLELAIELRAGYRTLRTRETYRFDPGRNLWSVNTDKGAYVATASPWTGYKWVFDGFENVGGWRGHVRMVYFDLGDQAFRRDFQVMEGGTWRTYSAETCRRPSN